MWGTNYNDHRVSMGYSVRTRQEMDRAFYNRAQWSEQFAWWPHRCELTKKIIWLQRAYRGQARWTGPGDDAVETRWHDFKEHVFWTLKGPHG